MSEAANLATASTAPLRGLRVVELARILAGPWIGQTLADLGADVIKVEAPEGDETRRWGPPFVEGRDGQPLDAAYFHACNRGKRSVVADFRSKSDLAMVHRLVERADVLIENFKTGGLAKFGLDFAQVHARNPRLIYCSVTGFGQDGPYATRPGYDTVAQAMSGFMDLTGEPGAEPQKIGVALGDILTGVYGVVGIQSALAQRERTGLGQQVDMALLDVLVGALANQALNYFVSGNVPHRMGNAHPNIVPYQTFATRTGYLMLSVGNEAQYRRFCAVIGREDLATDARFVTNAVRVANRDVLVPAIAAVLATHERDALLQSLEAAGVPAAPINTVGEAMQDPQVIHRGMRLTLPLPQAKSGHVGGLRSPLRFSSAQLQTDRAAPALGEHTAQVRAELGLD